MKPEQHPDTFRPSPWEEDLVREAENLSTPPAPESWQRLESLLDSPQDIRRRPVIALDPKWLLAASLAGLVLLAWLLVRPTATEGDWTVQDISEPAAGYYRDYLAAAHGLSGYRPIGEGQAPLDTRHTPATAGEDTLRDL